MKGNHTCPNEFVQAGISKDAGDYTDYFAMQNEMQFIII